MLAGAGCGGFLALIGVSLASRGPRILLIDVALALATASLMDALLLVLPPTLKPMTVSLMPVVGIALFAASKNPSPSPPRRDAPQHCPARFGVVRTVALPLAVGLAYGLMQRLVGDVYAADGMGASAATVASFFLSSLIIAASALFFDSRALIKFICFVAIPLIGVAFVMLPLFSDGLEAAQSICIVGFNSFYFMVWALWTSDAQGAQLPARFIAGLLVLVGAESLGSVLGSGIAPNVADSDASLAIVCLVVVYLLLMAGMLSFDRGQVAARREQQRQEGAAPVGTRAFPPRQESSAGRACERTPDGNARRTGTAGGAVPAVRTRDAGVRASGKGTQQGTHIEDAFHFRQHHAHAHEERLPQTRRAFPARADRPVGSLREARSKSLTGEARALPDRGKLAATPP